MCFCSGCVLCEARPQPGIAPRPPPPLRFKAAKARGPLNTDAGGMCLLSHPTRFREPPQEVAEGGGKMGDTLLMGDCSPAG